MEFAVAVSGFGEYCNFLKKGHKGNHTSGIDDHGGYRRSEKQSNS